MRSVSPDVGGTEIQIATDQHEYMELTGTILRWPAGMVGVLTRWKLSEIERAQLVDGEDLYLTVLTFGQPLQPLRLTVGVPDDLPE